MNRKEKCPKCENEKIAHAKQPNLETYHYCAQCDYEWKEVTRLTKDKLRKNYRIEPEEGNMI